MADAKRPTVRSIAAEAGVSPATVSAALRPAGAGAPVAQETRERIVRLAERMGYDLGRLRPGSSAATTVAVYCPAGTHPNAPVVYPIVLELSERLVYSGLRTMLHCGHGALSDARTAREMVARGEADAVIGVATGEDWAQQLAGSGVPYVAVGPASCGDPVCQVNVDDAMGGRLVGEYLWALGHRRVGVVHMAQTVWGDARQEGLRSVWERAGEAISDECVRVVDEQTDAGADEAVRGLLEGHHPTALFCDADWLASHALRTARSLGLRVPRDVSVVGFDDANFATAVDPPLTTVRQPVRELAALAVQLLLEQLSTSDPAEKSYSLPCELVVRESTGAAPE